MNNQDFTYQLKSKDMKHKNSWEMSKNETIFNKKERKESYAEYQKKHLDSTTSKSKFICGMCGKYHSWSELGKKH